jgi:hypothetical protein
VIAHAAYVGLSGYPVVHGKPDYAFLTDSVNGSLDGEYFSQGRGLSPQVGERSWQSDVPEKLAAFMADSPGLATGRPRWRLS